MTKSSLLWAIAVVLFSAVGFGQESPSAAGDSPTIRIDAETTFEPIRYRPLPASVEDGSSFQDSLDGTWKIHPSVAEDPHEKPLDAEGWKDVRVPGQWRQQRFDLPADQTVAMAKEFVIPAEWSGQRIFLRFNAIHAGTHYWLNGQKLGYSENLFTPVEWELTKHVRFGETNRLDLAMKVDTVSETLSTSSTYAAHNLGGIDRSVSVYALPQIHVRSLRVTTDLDEEYQDADLRLRVAFDNPAQSPGRDLALAIEIRGPDGQPMEHTVSNVKLDSLAPGETVQEIATHVNNPVKWNAEKPVLYKLTLALTQGDKLLERIERNVGFREIEVRGGLFLVNGVSVKLAGAGRHEVDPLTGRADTMRHAEGDVRLLKGANLNYIRTTHYPPTIELVEAADRLGMYLEVEAPFCWSRPERSTNDRDALRAVLAPTSAMIDYYHSHPSVVIWSVANESHHAREFEISEEMIERLDPTRPTTFNMFEGKPFTDIKNLHYPHLPYDDQVKDDPRPLLFGEYFFPVCHEQTDVRINPGLRELYGFGGSEPDSAWGRECMKAFAAAREPSSFLLKPGIPPGGWTQIVRSKRVIGGAIFAALDDSFYFSDGTHAGYAWLHGFWGLIDAWRRPKPEWWITKMVFSPVWFPSRHLEYVPGQSAVLLPVENRYSFTNLDELRFTWEIGEAKGEAKAAVAPGTTGNIEIPLPQGTMEGAELLVRAVDGQGGLIGAASIQLGRKTESPLPQPTPGAPTVKEENDTLLISGNGFALVFDKSVGDFRAGDPRHQSPITRFPSPHVTRFDFGDLAESLGEKPAPYAVFPDAKTRVVEDVAVKPLPEGLEITVRDHYDLFAGQVVWLFDINGTGRVRYDYEYSGEDMNTREAGIRFELKPACDELSWRRWSEWGGFFPQDSICRTEGRAKALRTGKRGTDPENIKPTWPWSQDQTELGTADFRSIKFHIYEASLRTNDGSGLRVRARADAHVRSCLGEENVLLHVLSRCTLGHVVLKKGDRISGEFAVQIITAK